MVQYFFVTCEIFSHKILTFEYKYIIIQVKINNLCEKIEEVEMNAKSINFF